MVRVLMVVLLLVTGCGGVQAPLRESVDKTVVANNATVQQLERVQEGLRQMRKTLLDAVAASAKTEAEGLKQMDAIDKRFAHVRQLLEKLETMQGVLAQSLETAQKAVAAGENPDVANLLALYAELQGAYNALLVELGGT